MMKTKLIGVMACDPNGLIGSTTAIKLPWSYPEDSAFWKRLVKNKPLIAGFKTFNKLPSHLLQENLIVIISAHHESQYKNHLFFKSIDEFLNSAIYQTTEVFYHLGGGKTMNQFLERQLIDEFFLTEIKKTYLGDIFLEKKYLQNWPKTCIYPCDDFDIMHYIKKVPS